MDIILRGVDKWNAWRKDNPEIMPDFGLADFDWSYLSKENLSKGQLSRADLRGANLRGADLSGADLRGADLSGADLSWADLSGANLRGADLSGANLRGAILRKADLSVADLRGANLSVARLSRAILRKADLSKTNLSGADLSWAIFRKANLSGANLRGADLSGANLRGADLSGANLRKADLSGADLRRADLSGADLRRADLRRADLSGADLRRADLEGARIDGVNWVGSEISYARIDAEQLSLLKKTFPPDTISTLQVYEWETPTTQDRETIIAEINIPGETNSQTEERIMAAVGNLLEAYGFEPEGESQLERGSFFETIVFSIIEKLTPQQVKAVLTSLFDGLKNVLMGTTPHTQQDLKQIQAIKEVWDVIKDLDEAVIRIQNLLIVKYGGGLMVETIPVDLAAEMKKNPLILQNPKAVWAFLEKQEQLQKVPADPPQHPDDEDDRL
jgi:uncharacterized protein YjbI with pentapeptide repeats